MRLYTDGSFFLSYRSHVCVFIKANIFSLVLVVVEKSLKT